MFEPLGSIELGGVSSSWLSASSMPWVIKWSSGRSKREYMLDVNVLT